MKFPFQLSLAVILLTTVFIACQESKKKVPDYVWEEDKFVEVMAEFQLAEAIVRLGYHRTTDSMYYNDSIYHAAFKKMNVTEEMFDSNYNYYLKQPKQLEEIYEKVITRLSQRSAELEKAKQPKEEAAQADSLR